MNNSKWPGQLGLTLARLCLAGWVVAAVLFVLTSVAEQTSSHFESLDRDVLALLRFPWFYRFGFALLGLGLVGGLLCGAWSGWSRHRYAFVVLVVMALLLLTIDYFFIYGPLWGMLDPPGQPRTPDFTSYHTASRRINEMGLLFSTLAAIVICLPESDRAPESTPDN
ncbi:MAG: hypothetical protein ACR2NP_01215 [Pirellulaceae bacterium]